MASLAHLKSHCTDGRDVIPILSMVVWDQEHDLVYSRQQEGEAFSRAVITLVLYHRDM